MSDATKVPAVPTGAPPRWANRIMAGLLRTPGVQRLLGRQLALLTVTGRRSGRRYVIPVSYERTGDEVMIVTKRVRAWWRNLVDRPAVLVRLAGRELAGRARIAREDTDALQRLLDFLQGRPIDAKAYGLHPGPDGGIAEEDVRALLPQLVVVIVELTGDA